MDKNIFKGKKVLVMGLGLHGGGVGVAKFFCNQGAEVLVTDLKTEQQLQESVDKLKNLKVRFALGGHKESDFIEADLIIKNPDVPSTSPYLEIARKNDIPVETDVGLFFKLSRAFIVGVTGTKGKSTTVSLIYHFLKSEFNRVFLAGNIGVSPLELLPELKKGDKVVLELSSFELEGLDQSPHIAVITNIMEDHLNRYGTMAGYVEAKKIIFKYQRKEDVLILNEDDSFSKEFAKSASSKVHFFSGKKVLEGVGPDNFKLFGKHNLANLAAAVEVAKIFKIKPEEISEYVKDFGGVPNRQEFIKEVEGVKYFNDTTATMPDAVVAAIDSFSDKFPASKLIFICGGQNKGLKFTGMAKAIQERVSRVILLPGTASAILKEELMDFKEIYEVSSMEDAVKKSYELASTGDVVVLSPGAASFNLFKNEFDRGRKFVESVNNILRN